MLIGLIITTILTSAADSLNPVAITQQFVLQGMVKKPKHIWFFILATGVTNFIGGLMVYYGLVTVISGILSPIFEKYGRNLYIFEFIMGIAALMLAFYFVLKQKIQSVVRQVQLQNPESMEESDEQQITQKIKSVSPFSLAVLGVIATISELTTALPYFAFLAVLLNYELTVIQVVSILLLYNFIYSSPLMILYFIYMKKQSLFERVYSLIKKQMARWSVVIIPLVLALIGVVIIHHSVNLLLG